ncbi:MAG: ArsR family transcriptional regulator [Dehalococcoidia bacterium]|nr:ArsR family transcriptional regulator [Dehalococcoidia bacterium]
MVTHSCLELIQPTRQELLRALKQHGPATAELLAAGAYLSPGAVRQHLMALEAQGLVRFEVERAGPGRPRHLFSLTEAGHQLFPQAYDTLSRDLLDALEGEEPEVRARVLDRLGELQFDRHAGQFDRKDIAGRVEALHSILEEDGYLPVFFAGDGGTTLRMVHCPHWRIAKQHPEVCELELVHLQRALGAAVLERISHRLLGDRDCSYRLAIAN